MTEQQNNFEPTGGTDFILIDHEESRKQGMGRKLVIGAVALVAVIGAGIGAMAYADGGMGPGQWRGKFMRGFMEYRVEQILTDVGASTEQKDKIKTIFKTTMDEVRPQRGEHKQMHEQVVKLLEAPTIDRNAIEALRAKKVAEIDAKSKIIAKAVADAAEILTPDQRKKLIEEWGDFGPGHDGPDEP